MLTTIESTGATHYELASHKNFMDNNKKVIIRIHKDDSYAYIACSDKLSDELRNCNSSTELLHKIQNLRNLSIGIELEVLS